MAFKAYQITPDAATATPVIVVGTGDGQIVNWPGSVSQMIPVSIKNEDASALIYWGGPDVDDTHGQSIAAGGSVPLNLFGEGEIPYVWSADGTVVSVVVGQQ